MRHAPFRLNPLRSERSPAPLPDARELARRSVDRAAAELAAGAPVLLAGGGADVVLAAETASARGLAEFSALAGAPPTLLLAPARGAAVLQRPSEPDPDVVALRLNGIRLSPELLGGVSRIPLPASRSRPGSRRQGRFQPPLRQRSR